MYSKPKIKTLQEGGKAIRNTISYFPFLPFFPTSCYVFKAQDKDTTRRR
jgi:hypothetical protein